MSDFVNITADQIQPGDVWLGRSEVTVDHVEPGATLMLPSNPFAASSPEIEIQMVRITGRITKGDDRSRRVLSWSLRPDQEMEVRRA